MRYIVLSFLIVLCSSCTLKSYEVPLASLAGAKAVVFDIDGTLTPRPSAIFSERKNAADAVRLYAEKGYHIVYLSARVKMFQSKIPNWLAKHNFPDGSVHVPQSKIESDDHAVFKLGVLRAYQEKGWSVAAAYGDSSTDFAAYADAGVAKSHVFALQRSGEEACKPGVWALCLQSWTEHLPVIAAYPAP